MTSILKVNTLQDSTGNTALNINSNGSVIINNDNRPRFQLGFTEDDDSNVGTCDGTNYRITYTQAIINSDGAGGTCVADAGGGTYHTFTAPISGLYLFFTNHYALWTSNNSRAKAMLAVDDNSGHDQTFVAWNANWETNTSVGLTHPIYLNANQTVASFMALYDSNGTTGTFQIKRNKNLSYFGGYLIG